MVLGSVSGAVLSPGAEMCYSTPGLLAGAPNVLAGAVWKCAIILGVAGSVSPLEEP